MKNKIAAYFYTFHDGYFKAQFNRYLEDLSKNQWDVLEEYFNDEEFIAYIKDPQKTKVSNNQMSKMSTKLSAHTKNKETFEKLISLREAVVDEGFENLIKSIPDSLSNKELYNELEKLNNIQKDSLEVLLINAGIRSPSLHYVFNYSMKKHELDKLEKKSVSSLASSINNNFSIRLLIKSLKDLEKSSISISKIEITEKQYEASDFKAVNIQHHSALNEFENNPIEEKKKSSSDPDEENSSIEEVTESGDGTAEAYFYIFSNGYFNNQFKKYLKDLDEAQWNIVREYFKEDEYFIEFIKDRIAGKVALRNKYSDRCFGKISKHLQKKQTFEKLISLRDRVLDEEFESLIDSIPDSLSKEDFCDVLKELSDNQKESLKKCLEHMGIKSHLLYVLNPSRINELVDQNQINAVHDQLYKILNNFSVRLLIKSLKDFNGIPTSEIKITEKIYMTHPSSLDNTKKRKISPEPDEEPNDLDEETAPSSHIKKISRISVELDEENSSIEEATESGQQELPDITESGKYKAEAYFYIFPKSYFRDQFNKYLKNLNDNQWSVLKEYFNDEVFIKYIKGDFIADRKINCRCSALLSNLIKNKDTFENLFSLRTFALDEDFENLIKSVPDRVETEELDHYIQKLGDQKNILKQCLEEIGIKSNLDYIFDPSTKNDLSRKEKNSVSSCTSHIKSMFSVRLLIKALKELEASSVPISQIKITRKNFEGYNSEGITLLNYLSSDDSFLSEGDNEVEIISNSFDDEQNQLPESNSQVDEETADISTLDGAPINLIVSKVENFSYDNQLLNSPHLQEMFTAALKYKSINKLIELGQDREVAELISEQVQIDGAEEVMEIIFAPIKSISEIFFEAIDRNDINEVIRLVSKHPDLINARNKDGNSAVFMSSIYSNNNITDFLLANGFEGGEYLETQNLGMTEEGALSSTFSVLDPIFHQDITPIHLNDYEESMYSHSQANSMFLAAVLTMIFTTIID